MAKGPGRLILVRHGKTVLNSLDAAERLRGWLDVPLDEVGLAEAEVTGDALRHHPVTRIYCSDLLRARQTGEALERATGAPITYTGDLRPWNVGSLAGQRVQDILPILKQLEVDPTVSAPDGEPFVQFYERYSSALRELLQLAEQSGEDIVAVTHVRNLLALPTVLYGGDLTKIPVHGGPRTSALVWVEWIGEQWSHRVEESDAVVGISA